MEVQLPNVGVDLKESMFQGDHALGGLFDQLRG